VTWLWWLDLVGAALLLAVPTWLILRRAGARRVPLIGVGEVRPPWWALGALFPAFVLLSYGSHGLSGDGPTWALYYLGAGAVSFAVQALVVTRHNRRVLAAAEH
jgi:hypothetical protein